MGFAVFLRINRIVGKCWRFWHHLVCSLHGLCQLIYWFSYVLGIKWWRLTLWRCQLVFISLLAIKWWARLYNWMYGDLHLPIYMFGSELRLGSLWRFVLIMIWLHYSPSSYIRDGCVVEFFIFVWRLNFLSLFSFCAYSLNGSLYLLLGRPLFSLFLFLLFDCRYFYHEFILSFCQCAWLLRGNHLRGQQIRRALLSLRT